MNCQVKCNTFATLVQTSQPVFCSLALSLVCYLFSLLFCQSVALESIIHQGMKKAGQKSRFDFCIGELLSQLLVAFVSFLSFFLVDSEELFSNLRLSLSKLSVSVFAEEEFLVIGGSFFAVEGERILALLCEGRIVSVELPVTCRNCLLLFDLAVGHIDTVVDTRSVADDEGRTVISFCFLEGIDVLIHISAHSNLSNVYVTVAHSHLAEVFLLGNFTACGKLSYSTRRRGLGGLTAGVGVNFGIENNYVDILTHSEYVVETAVTDIVCPAVAAECPYGLLDEAICILSDILEQSFLFSVLFFCRSIADSSLDSVAVRLVSVGVLVGFHPAFEVVFESLVNAESHYGFHIFHKLLSALVGSGEHTETELCVVFEQAVSPRGTFALLVLGVRAGRSGAAVNGRTARSVGDNHSVAVKLGDDLEVRSFAAACARAGELEQRTVELAADNGISCDRYVAGIESVCILPVFSFARSEYVFEGSHYESLFLSGADVSAVSATRTVERRNLNSELIFLSLGILHIYGSESSGSVFESFGLLSYGKNTSVRTYEGTLITLQAVFLYPYGNFNGDTALFELGRAGRNRTVSVLYECGNGEFVAFLSEDGSDNLGEVFVIGGRLNYCALGRGCPVSGVVDSLDVCDSVVDSRKVHIYDFLTLLGEGLNNEFFHMLVGVSVVDYVSELEEASLHSSRDTVAETYFAYYLDSVDIVELDMLFSDSVFHACGEVFFHILESPRGVEEESAAFLEVANHIVFGYVRRIVASYEVSLVDEVCASDRGVAESQVGYGDTARLLGVVSKVCLSVFLGVVADNLDGVFIAAYGTVRAESVELAGDCALRSGVDFLLDIDGGIGNVVDDADGEVILGILAFNVLEDSVDHRRGEFLAAEAVSAAGNVDILSAGLVESCHNVEVERFACAAAFLNTVENDYVLNACGDSVCKHLSCERTEESYFEYAVLAAFSVEVIYGFADGFCAAAHKYDDAFCVFSTVVLIRLVLTSGDSLCVFHSFFHDSGNCVVVAVASFTVLEVDIGVLSGTLLNGVFGVESTLLEVVDILGVFLFYESLDVGVVGNFNLRNFVRSSETVEEVHKRNLGLEGSEMSYESEVHNFLYRVGAEHSKARLTASHYVGVVAEDIECVISESTCAYVEYARGQLARDFVHIGNHKKQALASRKGSCERACHQGTVYCACRTCFGLHFYNLQNLTENIFSSRGCPFVAVFCHRGRRGDRINSSYFAERIGDMSSSCITIDSHFLTHYYVYLRLGLLLNRIYYNIRAGD